MSTHLVLWELFVLFKFYLPLRLCEWWKCPCEVPIHLDTHVSDVCVLEGWMVYQCHTIDSPDPVSRVSPPTMTIVYTNPAHVSSHTPTALLGDANCTV